MCNCKQDCTFIQREGDKDLSGKGRGRIIVRCVGEWACVCVDTCVHERRGRREEREERGEREGEERERERERERGGGRRERGREREGGGGEREREREGGEREGEQGTLA